MRINISSAALAGALADSLMGEGYDACWLVSYDGGKTQVITSAPRHVVSACLTMFGHDLPALGGC